MTAAAFRRQTFLSRLLLLSAAQSSTRCEPCAVNMTFATNSSLDASRRKPRMTTTDFVIDSGATIHCINDITLFNKIDTNHPPVKLRVANGEPMVAHAIGDVKLSLQRDDGTTEEILIHNVVYHPNFSHNLLSVRRLWKDNGLKTKFGSTNYFKCRKTNARYTFGYNDQFQVQSVRSVSRGTTPSDVIHSRFGHCGTDRLHRARSRGQNFPAHDSIHHDPNDCDACQRGGMRRKPFPKRAFSKYTHFGQKLSSDLCGPFTTSVDGKNYALVIVDAATTVVRTYYLETKSSAEVRAAFDSFISEFKVKLDACRSAGHDVTWHTDNGGEFMSHDLAEFCEEFAVKRSFSTPYAPPQNGQAERMWGILLRTMRITMAESGLSERFWTYAMDNAARLHNSLPSRKHRDFISPWEMLYGRQPDLGKFRVFGCQIWYFLPEHERSSKLGPRSVPGINLGIDPQRNGWIVYIPSLNRITTMYHGTFQEKKFMMFRGEETVLAPSPPSGIVGRATRPRHHAAERHYSDGTGEGETGDSDPEIHIFDPQRQSADDTATFGADHCEDTQCQLPKGHDGPHDYERVGTRQEGARRTRRPPQRSDYEQNLERNFVRILMEDSSGHYIDVATHVDLGDIKIPKTFEESQAPSSLLRARWLEAMKKEITELLRNKTWELVDRSDLPRGKSVTKSKWVYDIKYLRDGTIERFKARFVACGYSQIFGKDFYHTFSATLRATSFRLLLSIAAGRKLRVHQFDVSNAFTQADIDTELYVEPPKGFETTGKDGRSQVLKLKKALYGTKQAARLWQETLVKRLKDLGFKQSTHDPCLFRYDGPHGECLIGAYVDDLLCAVSSDKMLEWFKSEFIASDTNSEGFRAKYLGPAHYFLGMAIDQHADFSISVHQTKYIEKMLNKFVPSHNVNAIKHSKPCVVESFKNLSTAADDIEREKVKNLPYLQVIGSLLYVSCMTRPDAAFYVATLCKFMHDPSIACYDAAITLLLYLGHTKGMVGLYYDGNTSAPEGFGQNEVDRANVRGYVENNHGFVAYSDASWRSKMGTYSAYGYVVYLYGGVVSFAAKFLKVVALSSAEAEYAAASQTCREITFIRNVCDDLGVTLRGRLCIGVDNTAAISIIENPGVTARNKHFDDSMHYIRSEYTHSRIRPVFVTTDKQRADGFTKPLDWATLVAWRGTVIPTTHPSM